MAQVYALLDPVTEVTRCIGITCGYARERYSTHISKRAMPKVREWVDGLRSRGLLPKLVILAVTSIERARALELHLIGADTSLLNTRHVHCDWWCDRPCVEGEWDDNCPDMLDIIEDTERMFDNRMCLA